MADTDDPRPTGGHDGSHNGSADDRLNGTADGSAYDEHFERLRAGDPAAGDAVDLTALRREVDRRIAGTASAGAGAGVGAAAAGPGRTGWWRVAAVAAAVAVVGSGAFVVGRQTGTTTGDTAMSAGTTTVVAAPASTSAIAPGVPEAAPAPAGAGGASAAAGGTGASAGSAKDSSLAGWGGRTHFNDGGLPTDRGAAEAWGYDGSQIVSAQTAEKIAAAVGIAGTAVVQYQSWTVGPVDGSGPTVSLMGDSMGSVSYNDPQAYPSCVAVGKAEGDAVDGSGAASAPDSCTTATPADISADDAIARSTELMGRIGLDPAAFVVTSPDDQSGSGFRTVLATTTIGGLATGQQWSFSFVGDRLAGFYGALAPLVSLGRYDIVSPAEAVARMNDPRFGVTLGAYPIDIMTTDAPVAPAEPDPNVVPVPTAPVPGGTISWPVTEITLTGASLGLVSQYQADGTTLLLPAYTMTDGSGASWSVVAVADDRLEFTG